MDEENPVPGNIEEFMRAFEEMKRKMAAVEVLTEIVNITENPDMEASDEEKMEEVLNILLAYGDRCVMESLNSKLL